MIRNLVDEATVEALRRECGRLVEAHTEDSLAELGYNVDLWHGVELPSDSSVRTHEAAYCKVRSAAAQTPPRDEAALRTLLFDTLPTAIRASTGWETVRVVEPTLASGPRGV